MRCKQSAHPTPHQHGLSGADGQPQPLGRDFARHAGARHAGERAAQAHAHKQLGRRLLPRHQLARVLPHAQQRGGAQRAPPGEGAAPPGRGNTRRGRQKHPLSASKGTTSAANDVIERAARHGTASSPSQYRDRQGSSEVGEERNHKDRERRANRVPLRRTLLYAQGHDNRRRMEPPEPQLNVERAPCVPLLTLVNPRSPRPLLQPLAFPPALCLALLARREPRSVSR